MRATENQGSFLNRISIRRNQVVSMDGNHEQELEDIEIFQKHVAERFSTLLSAEDSSSSSTTSSSSEPLLSIAWLRKLLDAFLCCEAEFKVLLIIGREPAQVAKPPLDRLVPELLERSVKALDICNAATHGVEAVRHCQKLAEIAVAALAQRPMGDGQVRRARKALGSLAAAIAAEEKDGAGAGKATERAWSFGRKGASGNKDRSGGHFRSTWWGMAKGWSAAKQIQAMSANLAAPRGAAEMSGLAHPVYIMSTITVFVMWALVAAIPCQERAGLAAAAQIPAARQLGWAQPVIALQERIAEEWKRKEKRGSAAGLMEEMQRMERAGQALAEFADSFRYPAEAERAEEAAAQAAELAEACRRMEEGLVPLQQQIREVFHKVVRTRTEVLEVLDQVGKLSTPTS